MLTVLIYLSLDLTIFGCSQILNVKYDYTANLAGTGDRSECDIRLNLSYFVCWRFCSFAFYYFPVTSTENLQNISPHFECLTSASARQHFTRVHAAVISATDEIGHYLLSA